jgi:hypothetical protein
MKLTPQLVNALNLLAAALGPVTGVQQPKATYKAGPAKKRTVKGAGKPKKATSRVAKRASTKKATPAWLLERGANSAARKALAKAMRENGGDPSDRKQWDAAKQVAGIK